MLFKMRMVQGIFPQIMQQLLGLFAYLQEKKIYIKIFKVKQSLTMYVNVKYTVKYRLREYNLITCTCIILY